LVARRHPQGAAQTDLTRTQAPTTNSSSSSSCWLGVRVCSGRCGSGRVQRGWRANHRSGSPTNRSTTTMAPCKDSGALVRWKHASVGWANTNGHDVLEDGGGSRGPKSPAMYSKRSSSPLRQHDNRDHSVGGLGRRAGGRAQATLVQVGPKAGQRRWHGAYPCLNPAGDTVPSEDTTVTASPANTASTPALATAPGAPLSSPSSAVSTAGKKGVGHTWLKVVTRPTISRPRDRGSLAAAPKMWMKRAPSGCGSMGPWQPDDTKGVHST
jgi:hypothetical protein